MANQSEGASDARQDRPLLVGDLLPGRHDLTLTARHPETVYQHALGEDALCHGRAGVVAAVSAVGRAVDDAGLQSDAQERLRLLADGWVEEPFNFGATIERDETWLTGLRECPWSTLRASKTALQSFAASRLKGHGGAQVST